MGEGFHIDQRLRRVSPQVPRPGSGSVLMPPPNHVIGAAGIEAAVGTTDDIYKPGFHDGSIAFGLGRMDQATV